MRIDTSARWAIAAILDIAIHGTDCPVRLADISGRQGVSKSYLERLFRSLRKSGFVASVRGPGGGYRLIRRLGTLSVADVVASVDSHAFDSDPCYDTDRCEEDRRNVTDRLWRGLDDHLRIYLRSVNLESVLASAMDGKDPLGRRPVVAAVHCIERLPLGYEEQPAASIT